MLALLLASAWFVQDPHPGFRLDGVELHEPAAVVSALGWLEVTGRRGDEGHAGFKLRFPPLEWPSGEQTLGAGEVRAWLGTRRGEEGDEVRGTLRVTTFTHEHVAFTVKGHTPTGEHHVEVDLRPTLYVPRLAPVVAAEPRPADDEPDREDVVFCAFGNAGTGLPGQRQVAEAIARLAPTGPLDFVVLLGNNFLPRGVESERDPLFESRFEDVYDRKRLNVPFYVVQGPADHHGKWTAAAAYGVTNQRWTCRPTGFGVEFTCRGKRLAVFGADSPLLTLSISDSRSRTTMRGLFDAVRQSTADWKVVCTYHQLVSLGGEHEGPDMQLLEQRSRAHLIDGKVDLLLCAEGRGLRFVVPEEGPAHVLSGGGGGPEMAGVVENVPGTRFAWGGGGFAWLRFDGSKLQVSLRDAEGRTLFVHDLTKP
ncbi:MAG TPA: hypothetical protein VK081_15300, partial [Planctomycetota bacterium]|nr:hypothetical protein [Planctomycetota bacterium]